MKYEQPPENYSSAPPPPQQGVRVEVDNPASKPLVTYVILGVTVVVFLAQLLTQNTMGIDVPAAYLGKYNELILSGQLWRLITPVLVHGSIAHIAFNMYALKKRLEVNILERMPLWEILKPGPKKIRIISK